MKKTYAAAAMFVCLVGASVPAQETTWFDLENCEICKNMSGQEGLMEHIEWENHVIPNGMLSIAVIPDEFKSKMEAAHEGMKATIARLEGGESMNLCGFCQSYGSLVADGAEATELKTIGGDISLLTSEDPTVVARIQAHAKKSIEEFKKMMQHGHSHGEHGHGEHGHDHPHESSHGSEG